MINGGFQSGRQGEMSIAEYDKTLKHAEMLCGGDELQLNCSESAKWENTPSHDRNIKKPWKSWVAQNKSVFESFTATEHTQSTNPLPKKGSLVNKIKVKEM